MYDISLFNKLKRVLDVTIDQLLTEKEKNIRSTEKENILLQIFISTWKYKTTLLFPVFSQNV